MARVESVDGLGEALVSGQTTPSAWVVARNAPSDLPIVPAKALALAIDVEELYGVPQDVEWAADGEDVYVVQARPITVLEVDDGFDTPLDDHELTAAGIVEMVPGVLAPLVWQLNRYLLEEAFRSLLDDLGILRGDAAEDAPFVRRVRGRAAVDFDQLRAAAQSVPGAVEELEQQYFGASDTTTRESRPWFTLSAIRDVRTLLVRRKVIRQAEIVIRAVTDLRDQPVDLRSYDDEQLLAYLRRLVDFGARALTAELGVAAAAAAGYRRLELILAGHLGGVEAMAATQRVTVLGPLAQRSSDASAAIFAGPSWSELGLSPPSLSHAPIDTAQIRGDLERSLTSLPGWRRRRIMTGQIVDTRVHLVRRTIDEVVEQLSRREETKAAFLEIGGLTRRVLLELGSRLSARGLLSEAHDIELMSSAELVQGVRRGVGIERGVLGRRSNWLGRYEAEGQLPARFVGQPDRTASPLPEGDVLTGWPASPGRRQGKARVVAGATGTFERGEVLVAEATDASWSPLFLRAGAIVVERGGPLSHAAILARELGLPAVLNVEGATRVLDSQMVSVDGDQGVVVRLTETEEPSRG